MIFKANAAEHFAGDRVLVKVLAREEKYKLADKWTTDVFVVMDQPNVHIPIYRVKREDGQGSSRTLHWNNFYHLRSSLLDDSPDTNNPDLVSRERTDDEAKVLVPLPRKKPPIPKRCRTKQENQTEKVRDLENLSDNEEEVVITEIAKDTPRFKTRVDETERSMIVDDTTVHTYSDQEEDETEIEEVEEAEEKEEKEEDRGGVTQSAAATADQSGEELLE